MMKYNLLKITVMHVAIITLFMMMNTKGQEEDNGSSYPFVPDLEAIEGDCGGSLEKIVNETCKTLYYEFPEQINRKHSPRMQDVSALFEMVSIHNCCDTQCTELDLTAMCYND